MNGFNLSISPRSAEILATGLDIAVKAACMILVAGALHMLLGSRRTLARSATWNACLVGLLVLPAAVYALPRITIQGLPARQSETRQAIGPALVSEQIAPIRDRAEVIPFSLEQPASSTEVAVPNPPTPNNWVPAAPPPAVRGIDPIPIFLLVYVAIGGLLAAKLVAGLVAARALVHSCISVADSQWLAARDRCAKTLGITARVDLRWSSDTSVPAVLGVWRPAILLPVGLVRAIAPGSVTAILLHELAHVRRGDFAWNLALKLVQAVYWPHPFLWLMGKAIADVRERACDDLCINKTGSAESYRETLLFVAEGLASRPQPALGMAMARGSGLRARLSAISNSHGAERCLLHAPARLATIAVVVAVALCLGAVTLTHARPAARADEPKGREIEFRFVVKGTNTPIPHATAYVYGEGKSFEPLKLIADQNGKVAVPRPETSEYLFSVVAIADGYQEQVVRFSNKNPRYGPFPDAKVLELAPGELTVGGKVVDENGRPVAGATIGLRGMRKDQNWLAFSNIQLKTDADGRWLSSNMPADLSQLEVQVHHPEYSFAYEPADLASLKARASVSRLEKGLAIRGRVFDQAGKPIAGASVDQVSGLHHPVSSTETDGDGWFTLPDGAKPNERLAIMVSAATCAPDVKVVMAVPSSFPVEFRLQPGKTIRGRVIDTTGEPVFEAYVYHNEFREMHSRPRFVLTDRDGRFRIDEAPDEPIRVDISHPRYTVPVASGAARRITPGDKEYLWTLGRQIPVRGTVTDAATGEMIRHFRTSREQLDPKTGAVTALPADVLGGLAQNVHHYFGRISQVSLDAARLPQRIRVEAEGFKVGFSRPIPSGETYAQVDVKLSRLDFDEGDGPAGTVMSADGKPVSGAEVLIATNEEPGRIYAGPSWWPGQGLAGHSGRGIVVSDRDGRFTCSPVDVAFQLAAIHESGYGEASSIEFAKNSKIIVRPWGRLEGIALKGRKPAAHREVTVSRDDRGSGSPIDLATSVFSDDNGRFVVEKLAPGAWVVVDQNGNRSYTDVAPGLTTRVTLNRSGRPVVGRIVISGRGGRERAAVANLAGSGTVTIKSDKPRVPFPAELPLEERASWFKSWQDSSAGQAYLRGYVNLSTKVNSENGTFQFDSVPPGEYVLNCALNEVVDNKVRVRSEATTRFRMGPVAPDGTDEPLDLGAIVPSNGDVTSALNIGDKAPGFSIKSVDGKPLSLDDFKGKYVLLDFWATWCGPCIGQLPELRAIHEKFGNDPRFALVSLSLDEKVETVARFLKEKPCAWTQGFVGAWSDDEPVTRSYGIRSVPSLFLIGPDGTIQSHLMRGDAVRERVAGALNR